MTTFPAEVGVASPKPTNEDIIFILNAARWSPSGDNSQPWTFTIINPDTVEVHLRFEHDNVYEYNNGQPVFISAGVLIETMRIAASHRHRECVLQQSHFDKSSPDYILTLAFPPSSAVTPSPLFDCISTRSVNRSPYSTTPLTEAQVTELEASFGDHYTIQWHTHLTEKLRFLRLSAIGTNIRLSIKETYPIHSRIIDWNKGNSPWGIPVAAAGFSKPTQLVMQWALKSWTRVRALNFLGGVYSAIIELDLIPGLLCARHFTVTRTHKNTNWPDVPQQIEAGQAIQRFWLTATKLGLDLQPSFQSIIFAAHDDQKIAFTQDPARLKMAARLRHKIEALWGCSVRDVIFQGRIGVCPHSSQPKARSVRKPLHKLITPGAKSPP